MKNTDSAYRIVEVKNRKPHTLFHGIEGRREIPVNRWVRAKTDKKVRDGGGDNWYYPAFNVLFDREQCLKYLDRFNRGKKTRELWVVPIFIRGEIRPKPTAKSSPVMLAEFIYLPWPPENPYVQQR